MAKIFVTGRQPVETSEQEAKRIREMWQASKEKGKEYLLPKTIDLDNGNSFEGKDIRGFEIVDYHAKDAEKLEYDLSDQAQRAKVKAFEKEFEAWKAAHPDITEWHKYYFLREKGLIKMGKYRPQDSVIDNGDKFQKYNEYLKLFSSLGSLRYMREKARAANDPEFAEERKKYIFSLKDKISGGIPSISTLADQINFAPRRTEDTIKAEAKEFDKENLGMTDDIDVSLIPF
jgi:hypothetical protein